MGKSTKAINSKYKLPLIILGVIIVLVLVGRYFLGMQSSSDNSQVSDEQSSQSTDSDGSPTSSSSEQQSYVSPEDVFQETSRKFTFTRDQLVYFRIFGQDRVQYSRGSGATFAYKQNGDWTIAQENGEPEENCSAFDKVPEKYRPPCYDSATKKTMYVDSQKQSVNYPPSQQTSFIDQ